MDNLLLLGVFGMVIMMVGDLILFFTMREMRIRQLLQDKGVVTEATVTNVQHPSSESDWVVKYQFTTEYGQMYEDMASYSAAESVPRIGETIEIVYLPDNPTRSRVSGRLPSKRFLPIGLFFALLFSGGGAVIVLTVAIEYFS